MLLDGKIKRVALLAAVDICLRKMNHSPKRCVRNIIELGISAYPDKLSPDKKNELYTQLLNAFENGDILTARTMFTSVFL